MEYTLMHKRIPVADFELDSNSSQISKISQIYSLKHFPIGTVHKGIPERWDLNRWWRRRAVPASRDGLHNALERLGVSSSEVLLEKCLGLSLSDQYWIRPAGSALSWDEVNFFDNPFSEDVGNILLGHSASARPDSLMSPDNSSDGWLKKKWTIIDGKRFLLKGASGIAQQEPYNEALASAIMRRLKIPHVDYQIVMHGDYPYSACEDFITKDMDLISAAHLMETQKKPNHRSMYQHLLCCCNQHGINDVVGFLDKMLTVDFIIANEDRHFNNFGVIRNAETLEYLGMAPVYDNGTSMWFSTPLRMIRPMSPELPSKPFKATHAEQIKLVSSFDWLDLGALDGISEEFREILSDSLFIDDTRQAVLCDALDKRIELLENVVAQRSHVSGREIVDDAAKDIAEDVAYSGAAQGPSWEQEV